MDKRFGASVPIELG